MIRVIGNTLTVGVVAVDELVLLHAVNVEQCWGEQVCCQSLKMVL